MTRLDTADLDYICEYDNSYYLIVEGWAQLNFSGPEIIFAKFWEFFKNHLAPNSLQVSRLGQGVRGWSKTKVGHGRGM